MKTIFKFIKEKAEDLWTIIGSCFWLMFCFVIKKAIYWSCKQLPNGATKKEAERLLIEEVIPYSFELKKLIKESRKDLIGF